MRLPKSRIESLQMSLGNSYMADCIKLFSFYINKKSTIFHNSTTRTYSQTYLPQGSTVYAGYCIVALVQVISGHMRASEFIKLMLSLFTFNCWLLLLLLFLTNFSIY